MVNTTELSEKLYLDDLVVGQKFESGTYEMTAKEIIEFASNYDPQIFHLDDQAAKGTFFDGLAASGWHTAAVTMKLIVSSVHIDGGVIGAGGEVTWPKPTRPGDILHVESEIINIKISQSRPNRGIVTVRVLTKNQNNEELQTMVTRLVVFKRP